MTFMQGREDRSASRGCAIVGWGCCWWRIGGVNKSVLMQCSYDDLIPLCEVHIGIAVL